jgi:purine-binding chemotaxis protein CheW
MSGAGVHVTLHVGAESYALPVDNVVEIADFDAPTPVPGGPRELLGVRNLRGEVLPVFDLAAVLGIAADGDPVKLVVAEDRIRRRAGLAIAGVHSVDELPAADQIADSPLLAGAALTDEGLVGVVDVEQLFAQLAEGSR